MSNAIVRRTRSDLQKWLNSDSTKGVLKRYCRGRIDPAQLANFAMIAATSNPKIVECDEFSILKALIDATTFDLDCSGLTGQAYLIPRGNKLQCQLGYKGVITLMTRGDGPVNAIDAEVVRTGDHFDYSLGTKRVIDHRPGNSERDDDITHAYAVAWLKDGSYQFRVLSREQIEKRRAVSQQPNGEMWTKWYAEACKKTAIMALKNVIPLSVEIGSALARDDRGMDLTELQPAGAPERDEPESAADRLADEIDGDGDTIDAEASGIATFEDCAKAWSEARGMPVEFARRAAATWLSRIFDVKPEKALPEQFGVLLDKIKTPHAIKWSIHERGIDQPANTSN